MQRSVENNYLTKNRYMARLAPYFLFIAGISFIVSSCCKEYCFDENIFAIDFRGFTAADLEKVKILRYKQDDFTTAVDSFVVNTNNIVVRDTTRIFLDTPLTSNFHFKINVVNPALTYTLSDFQLEKMNCRCTNGTYKKIVSYKVNGVQRSMPNYYPLEIIK